MKTLFRSLFIFCLVTPFITHAIIIRHDTEDRRYLELAEKYQHWVVYADGCMGTVLNEFWVITAAHCVNEQEQRPFWLDYLGDKRPVRTVFVHPNYRPGIPGFDIALLQLSLPLANAPSIKLYAKGDELNKQVIFVGRGDFGNGQQGVLKPSNQLRAAQNTVIATEKSELLFRFDTPDSALPLEGISGPHDSGGPALLEVNDDVYLLAVSSWQDFSKQEGLYGVTEHYTRISSTLPWIEANLAAHSLPKSTQSGLIKPFLQELESGSLSTTQLEQILGSSKLTQELLIALNYQVPSESLDVIASKLPQIVNMQLSGVSLIQYAIEIGHWPLVKALVNHGANIKHKNSFNEPLLSQLVFSYAESPEALSLIKLFVSKGANVNESDDIGLTPLAHASFQAANNKDYQLVQTLLTLGADPNLATVDGYVPLMEAVRQCDTKLTELLLAAKTNKHLLDEQKRSVSSFLPNQCQIKL